MLLTALYEFAKRAKNPQGKSIIDIPEYESRRVHWIIELETDGRLKGFIRCDANNESGLLFHNVPRTLEPKDSGEISEFLVEDMSTIMRLGDAPQDKLQPKAIEKYNNFWQRNTEAYKDLQMPELKAVLDFKENLVKSRIPEGVTFEEFKKNGGKKTVPQWLVTIAGAKYPVQERANSSIDWTFKVNGKILFQEPQIQKWWTDWFRRWLKTKEEKCSRWHTGGVCLVTGNKGVALSDSHLPKIKGVPGTQGSGASLVSAESDSFHSYGLSEINNKLGVEKRSKPDASYSNVSVNAAIAYCNALNYLLNSENHCIKIRPSTAICFWTKEMAINANIFAAKLNKPDPKSIADFLKAPFSGLDRELAKKDKFYSVTLSGNSGRVVVRNWIQTPVEDSVLNLQKWFRDLEIETIWQYFEKEKTNKPDGKNPSAPLALFSLARTSVREPEDLRAETVTELYRAALENSVPSISMLKQVLHRFKSDLVDKKRANYAWSPSRFALIKLILIRNSKEGEFMPDSILNENTTDPAYNCGRLLAVFGQLQEEAHKGDDGKPGLTGPGIVEKYYGGASTSPVSAFGILWRLHQHHLRKLRRRNEKGRVAANAIEGKIAAIALKFTSLQDNPNMAPELPRFLNLQEQGKFALGFYQQKAKDKHNITLAIAARKESEKESV